MPAPKGHKRYGGRRAGTPNRKTQDLLAICEEEGLDVFRAMIHLAKNADPAIRMAMLKELAQYLFPKRKAVEISGELDMKLVERIKEIEALPEIELKKLAGK